MTTSHTITLNSTASEPIVVKSATCTSLSGNSDLTYLIVFDSDNEIYFYTVGNTGNGLFSCEWIALSAIEEAIENRSSMTGITAFTLTRLFKGKSINTPAFLLAVLKVEGLVQTLSDRKRACEPIQNSSFVNDKYALVDAQAGSDIKPSPSKKKPRTTSKASGSTGNRKS